MLAVKRKIKPSDIIYKRPNYHTPYGLRQLYFANISLNEHHPDIYDSLLDFCLEEHPKIISDQRWAGPDLVGLARRRIMDIGIIALAGATVVAGCDSLPMA
jgi:hypothetical protein